ncbi:uncharacterized protein EV420DRAFT_1654153 [Desarmillaria tabescens]|uniref:Uncharacterized protein n=1 Tax=Armillaria tabescens TaxID=1929756 RepID=A0AA39MH74_ARMTA|nr:uncharacterized protein EV420DRAFT_1654153 [Desarmillaria tabescens]KAK0434177.1 hypothetical protein EV420DRAFT_1654153 [Desarmillaria tabescens]
MSLVSIPTTDVSWRSAICSMASLDQVSLTLFSSKQEQGSLLASDLQALINMASLPSENLACSDSTMYMSARSTDGEPAFQIPEAQVTSSTSNSPSNQLVVTSYAMVPEQNGTPCITVGGSGVRNEVLVEPAIPSAESSDHVSQDLFSSIARTPLFDKLCWDLAKFEEDLETVPFLMPLSLVTDLQKMILEVPLTSSSVPTIGQDLEGCIAGMSMTHSLPEQLTNPILWDSSSESSSSDDEEIIRARSIEWLTNSMLHNSSSSDASVDENEVTDSFNASLATPVSRHILLPSLILNVSWKLGNKGKEVEEMVMACSLEWPSHAVLQSTSEVPVVVPVQRLSSRPSHTPKLTSSCSNTWEGAATGKGCIAILPLAASQPAKPHTLPSSCHYTYDVSQKKATIPAHHCESGMTPDAHCSPLVASTTFQRDNSSTAVWLSTLLYLDPKTLYYDFTPIFPYLIYPYPSEPQTYLSYLSDP